MSEKIRGTVKWFNNSKGYGFIGTQNGDVFVHYSGLVSNENYKTLNEGDNVEFEMAQSAKGPQAINVRVV